MDKADLERERVSLLPVRELMTITAVREQRLAGNERIFLIKAHLEETVMAYRYLRTRDGLEASACRAAIGRHPLLITWQRKSFDKMAWNEHDIVKVEIP